MTLAVEYQNTLALLNKALRTLDELGEGIAAAHLSGVIDIISQRREDAPDSPH